MLLKPNYVKTCFVRWAGTDTNITQRRRKKYESNDNLGALVVPRVAGHVSIKCPKFGHFMDIFWTLSWILDKISKSLCRCLNCDLTLDTYNFQKSSRKVPCKCPKFWHILNVFWTYYGHYLWHLDTHFLRNAKCPKCGKILVLFWTYSIGLDIFWAHFGHIWGFGHILDILWTLLGVMCPKCVHPLIVLEHPLRQW